MILLSALPTDYNMKNDPVNPDLQLGAHVGRTYIQYCDAITAGRS